MKWIGTKATFTLPLIFMKSMSLKTLSIILMCFDGKNNHLKKTNKGAAIAITEQCRKY